MPVAGSATEPALRQRPAAASPRRCPGGSGWDGLQRRAADPTVACRHVPACRGSSVRRLPSCRERQGPGEAPQRWPWSWPVGVEGAARRERRGVRPAARHAPRMNTPSGQASHPRCGRRGRIRPYGPTARGRLPGHPCRRCAAQRSSGVPPGRLADGKRWLPPKGAVVRLRRAGVVTALPPRRDGHGRSPRRRRTP
jgi:hypothetical protein